MLRHGTEEFQDRRGKGPRGREIGLCPLELGVVREVALEQKESRLLERRMLGEVADVVSAVHEAPALPVDETD